jgi:hypothetical protein
MALRLEQLGQAFAAETEHAFTMWTLATPEPLAAVLAPGYFARCLSRFRLGDLVLCATRQPSTAPAVPRDGHTDRHRCLLMVTRLGRDGVAVRVVQDWGSPGAVPTTEPAAEVPVVAPAAIEARNAAIRSPRRRITGPIGGAGPGRARRRVRTVWQGAAR